MAAARGLLAGKPPLAALGQGEAAVAQLLLQNGDAGRRVAPLTVAYRPGRRQVGESISQAGPTDIAEIEDGELGAVGGIVALRLRRGRQRKREGGGRKEQLADHAPSSASRAPQVNRRRATLSPE